LPLLIVNHANFAGTNAVIGTDKTSFDTVLRAFLALWEYEIIACRLNELSF